MMLVRLSLAALVAAGAAQNAAQAKDWTEKVLFNFAEQDSTSSPGYAPIGGILLHGSTVYGTATSGGKKDGGTVYQYDGSGVKTLFNFVKTSTAKCGYNPTGALVRDSSGALYGVALRGGSGQGGVIFSLKKVSGTWTCSPLYSFSKKWPAAGNGYAPFGGLLRASNGMLYGIATSGGVRNAPHKEGRVDNGGGVVFQIDPSTKQYTVLHKFSEAGNGSNPGYSPAGPLVADKSGNLYGTTFFGGKHDGGVIYKLKPAGTSSTYTTLFKFDGRDTDDEAQYGYQPTYGAVTLDSKGNIYGETSLGGCSSGASNPICKNPPNGPAGVIFKLTPAGKYSVLYTFDSTTPNKGYNPYGGLALDSKGNLYGVTQQGGVNNGGLAFRLSTSKTLTLLFPFGSDNSGEQPLGPPTRDSKGRLFGITNTGGTNDGGVLYRLTKP